MEINQILANITIKINDEFINDYYGLFQWAKTDYNAYCSTNYKCNDYIAQNRGNDNNNIVDSLRHNSYIQGKNFKLLWGGDGYKNSSYDNFCKQLREMGEKKKESMLNR